MIKCNYHTHTTFCDGKNTPEELVLEAIRLGCAEIGFSGHSYTFFDESYCMSLDATQNYKDEIRRLKEKYGDRIRIYLGIEQDYYASEPTDDYDYVIGSVHYVKKDGVYLPIDESMESQKEIVERYYCGDYYSFVEDYYRTVSDVYQKTKCDIVGHFDLITIYNDGNTLFDTDDKRYRDACFGALEMLEKEAVAFEINTGAIARGYKKDVYPSDEIIERLKKANKKLVFSSDCHDVKNLLFGYDICLKKAEKREI